jgi:hypothetical protein
MLLGQDEVMVFVLESLDMQFLCLHSNHSTYHNRHRTNKLAAKRNAKGHDSCQHMIDQVKEYCADYSDYLGLASSQLANPVPYDQEMVLV